MRSVKKISSWPLKVATADIGLGDRWREYRNRLIANPRIRRLALGNPLTRRIARKKARDLFDICAGFVYSQILTACVQLRLFDLLADGPMSLDELGRQIGLSPDATTRLVDGAVPLGLLELRRNGFVGLGELGAALNANPGVKAMVGHHAALYDDLRDPVALLRGRSGGARLSTYWGYATSDKPSALSNEEVAAYSELMSVSQQLISEEVLAAYPLKRHRRLLDVGGGDGTFATAAAHSVPHLEVMTFDLPAVACRAKSRFENAKLQHRATAIGGDFTRDKLPIGADIISLIRVLYDHDDPKVLNLLRAVRLALPPNGKLLIAEPMSNASGATRVGDAYFGFYLLAMGSGRPRRPEAFEKLLMSAGFSSCRTIPTRMPLQTGVIIAGA